MSLGAASLIAGPAGWRIARQPGPDLAAHLQGRTAAEAAELLPRLFNLCRMAQGTAARLSLGLPAEDADTTDEVIRDHMARLFVTLRRAFGLAPLRLPAATPALFGASGHIPGDVAGLSGWLSGANPLAELGRAVQAGFPGTRGLTPALPPAGPRPGGMENSPAGRQAGHPLMRSIAATGGRSALWRFAGLLVDLEAALAGGLPKPQLAPDGTATVQAARGAYFLRIDQRAGHVTGLARLTPTDHQLAPGGALEQALHALPPDRPDLAARLVALFDPCVPVMVPQVQHA